MGYPSIGGQATGASVTAATAPRGGRIATFDARIRGWMVVGLVAGHAQAIVGQTIGFLVIDRLGLAPARALEPTGLVLMIGAGSTLLAQWGLIPLLDLRPRALVLAGAGLAGAGSAVGAVLSLGDPSPDTAGPGAAGTAARSDGLPDRRRDLFADQHRRDLQQAHILSVYGAGVALALEMGDGIDELVPVKSVSIARCLRYLGEIGRAHV